MFMSKYIYAFQVANVTGWLLEQTLLLNTD